MSETRANYADVPTKLVDNLSHSVCWKAFPQPLSEGYTIHNLAPLCLYTLILSDVEAPSARLLKSTAFEQLSCLRLFFLNLIDALNTLVFSNVETTGGYLKQGGRIRGVKKNEICFETKFPYKFLGKRKK